MNPMSNSVHSARLRRLAAGLAAALLSLFALVATASPALAHDELTGTDPADGAVVDAVPDAVTLTFSRPLLADAGTAVVEVTDAAGEQIQDGAPVIDGATVTQAINAPVSADGAYQVAWKVVSTDGHPISGGFSFTVEGAAPPAPTATPTQSATTPPAATPTATPAPAPSEDDSGPWPWAVVGVIGVAAAGAVLYLLVAAARRRAPRGD